MNIMNARLVQFPRGDGSISLVTHKEAKAFCALFKGLTPEQIAVKLSTKFLNHSHFLMAFERKKDHNPSQLEFGFPELKTGT